MSRLFIFILTIIALSNSLESYAECENLIVRPWRGLNCFHCLHPDSPGGAEPIVKLLRDSCLQRTIITFIVDGTFGWSEDKIISAIDELSNNNRNLWLHLYIYNGPAQRRWKSGLFNSFAVMDPAIFRTRMKSDKKLQTEYRTVIKERIIPILNYAQSRSVKVSIAPGLEDNLDDHTFKIALKILKEELSNKFNPQFVRSVCFQCKAGNGRKLPQNVLYEEHSDKYFRRVARGIINTDGRYFRFQYENNKLPTLKDWVRLLHEAKRSNNAFILWVSHFQDAPIKVVAKSPNNRNYRGPTENESREIIEFLRSN